MSSFIARKETFESGTAVICRPNETNEIGRGGRDKEAWKLRCVARCAYANGSSWTDIIKSIRMFILVWCSLRAAHFFPSPLRWENSSAEVQRDWRYSPGSYFTVEINRSRNENEKGGKKHIDVT